MQNGSKFCELSAGFFTLGFIAFPMPELFPRHYWLFHSLWHVLLAAGYYQLYALIEAESLAAYKEARRQKRVRAKRPFWAKEAGKSPVVAKQDLTLLSEVNAQVTSCFTVNGMQRKWHASLSCQAVQDMLKSEGMHVSGSEIVKK